MLTIIAANGCKRYLVRVDEKLTAFLELESAIWGCGELV
jgi:hypothetical protein